MEAPMYFSASLSAYFRACLTISPERVSSSSNFLTVSRYPSAFFLAFSILDLILSKRSYASLARCASGVPMTHYLRRGCPGRARPSALRANRLEGPWRHADRARHPFVRRGGPEHVRR